MSITPAEFKTYDYAIGGKMVVGKASMTDDFRLTIENGDAEAVRCLKTDLANQLAIFMLENKMLEFTYQDDPFTFSRNVMVRAYVASNDQVRILRSVVKV